MWSRDESCPKLVRSSAANVGKEGTHVGTITLLCSLSSLPFCRNLYNFCIIGRLLLTWFPQRPQALEGPLSTLCDPYLNLFRGLIPPLGGIDFSPILAFVILNTLTSTAAALPAEIDKVTGRCKSPKLDKPWEVHRWAAHTAAERKALKDKLKAREGR
eukprot:evm.model.scf_1232.4 EVM.evm.TU.scf_1232.4   scf_1232:31674-33368(+)